jgi:hypothetical protein
VVAGTTHVGLTSRNRGKLVIELLDDRFVCVFAVKKIFRLLKPVVGVSKVAWVDYELVVINGLCKALVEFLS